jgi:hypothetical protein
MRAAVSLQVQDHEVGLAAVEEVLDLLGIGRERHTAITV